MSDKSKVKQRLAFEDFGASKKRQQELDAIRDIEDLLKRKPRKGKDAEELLHLTPAERAQRGLRDV